MGGIGHQRGAPDADAPARAVLSWKAEWPSTVTTLETAQRDLAALAARVPPWMPLAGGKLRVGAVFLASATGVEGAGEARVCSEERCKGCGSQL